MAFVNSIAVPAGSLMVIIKMRIVAGKPYFRNAIDSIYKTGN
jgi:hypothetical protein